MHQTNIGRFIRASSISDAWHRGVNLIWSSGEQIVDERGSHIKELMNLEIVIEKPFEDMIPEGTSWNLERLEDYAKQLISGENPQGFEYTYGQRLRDYGEGIDQIRYAIDKLKANPSSRRAIAITWNPSIDTKVDEVPCMMLTDFKIRDGRVHLTTLFRSHDFAGAYPANLYGLAKLLEYVAKEIGCDPGVITTISISAHIYEHDWDRIEHLLGIPQ